jgi:hypothetical protein
MYSNRLPWEELGIEEESEPEEVPEVEDDMKPEGDYYRLFLRLLDEVETSTPGRTDLLCDLFLKCIRKHRKNAIHDPRDEKRMARLKRAEETTYKTPHLACESASPFPWTRVGAHPFMPKVMMIVVIIIIIIVLLVVERRTPIPIPHDDSHHQIPRLFLALSN